MSKRYGRNQKRRARERIAELEQRNEAACAVVGRQNGTIEEFREHLKYVAATLGHMNVLAGESLHHMDGHDRIAVSVEKPLPEFNMMDPDETVQLEIMRLLDVEAVRDMARRNIHAIIHMADHQSAYAMSEFSLKHMPREALRYFLQRQVTPLLCAVIAEQVAGK